MTSEEYYGLWLPLKKKFFPNDHTGSLHTSEKLAALIGINVEIAWDLFPLDPGLSRYLKLLLGQHHFSILKMYRIQKGLKT